VGRKWCSTKDAGKDDRHLEVTAPKFFRHPLLHARRGCSRGDKRFLRALTEKQGKRMSAIVCPDLEGKTRPAVRKLKRWRSAFEIVRRSSLAPGSCLRLTV